MKFFFATFLFIAPLCVSSADDPAQSHLRRFESLYKTSHSLQANFLQTYSENGRITRSESGTAYFRRPGKMRWEYSAPEKNLFLVDGKFAWFYVPADRTVTRVSARESADWRTPLALLAGEMKVSRVCSSTALASEQPADRSLVRLACTIRGTESEAKAGRPHDTATFDLDPSSGQLTSLVVLSPGGIQMELRFSHWQFDPPVPESLFHFQPPQGVAIVNGEDLLPGPTSSQQ